MEEDAEFHDLVVTLLRNDSDASAVRRLTRRWIHLLMPCVLCSYDSAVKVSRSTAFSTWSTVALFWLNSPMPVLLPGTQSR